MRQLRRASPLARIVATLGVLITLQAAVIVKFGSTVKFVPSALPTHVINLGDGVKVSTDRLYLLLIAAALTVVLWALYKYTRFGLGTTAVAENQRAAATLGWSPDVIATVNWTLGSALAGLAAILISPIVTLQVTILTNLVLAALAGALIASFRSFPIAFVASVVIGVVETVLTRYATQPGLAESVPFIVIVVVMVVTGRDLPLRDYFLQRLPCDRQRPDPPDVGASSGPPFGAVLILTTTTSWVAAITISLASALILLSIVVITGYAGQLSLAQFAIAGFGAWVAGRLVAGHGLPFLAAAAVGIVATVPLGLAIMLPAARTRGINFAVVTLGLGTTLELMLFDNQNYTGGIAGTAGRQRDPVRVEHQRHRAPGPLRDLRPGRLRRVLSGRRQRPAGAKRAADARRPDQRAGRRRPGHQRALGQALRVRPGGRPRSRRWHPAGLDQQHHHLHHLHQLHQRHLRRAGP